MPVLGYVTPNQQKRGLRNQRERFGKLFAAVNEHTIEGLAYDRAKYAHYVDASKPFGFIAFTAHEEGDPGDVPGSGVGAVAGRRPSSIFA